MGLNKIEKVCKEDKKVKDKLSKDLLSTAAEREKLKSEVGNLVMWKEESITKIKASIMFCQEEHVQKINDLEDNNELKSGMIIEINSRLSMMISEYSSNINPKEHEIDNLKLKLCEKEDQFKEKEKKLRDLEIKVKEK